MPRQLWLRDAAIGGTGAKTCETVAKIDVTDMKTSAIAARTVAMGAKIAAIGGKTGGIAGIRLQPTLRASHESAAIRPTKVANARLSAVVVDWKARNAATRP